METESTDILADRNLGGHTKHFFSNNLNNFTMH